jgi:hypothetical protein
VVTDLDGIGLDTVADFSGTDDSIELIGLSVSSGIGTSTVVFDNGGSLSAANGYLWTDADFV